MSVAVYGRNTSTASDVGLMAGSVRACVFAPATEHGWAYAFRAQVGRTGATAPNVRGQVWALDGSDEPDELLANTNTLTASSVMADGTSNAWVEGPLTAILPLIAGTSYAVGLATHAAQIMHGMFAAATLPSGTDKKFYNRTGIANTGPFDPMGFTASSTQGWLNAGLLYEPNVKPNVPIYRAPSGLLATAPSEFTGWFRDANEVVGPDDTANPAEKLNQIGIQLREQGDTGPLKWDATLSADSGEQSARAFSRAFGGSGTIEAGTPYEWRCRVSDARGAWSDWSSWLAFTVGSSGQALIQTNPDVSGRITTQTPTGFAVRYTHPTDKDTTSHEIRIRSGETTIRTQEITATHSNGDSWTIAPTWGGGGGEWASLNWGQSLTWSWRAIDEDDAPTDWSVDVAFNTNYRPSTPSGLTPSGGAVAYGFPLVTFDLVDLDNTPPALYAEVRIKDDESAVLQTRTASLISGTTWGYQTTAADLTATGTYKFDARGRDPDLDGNWSAEADFYYAESPEVLSPTAGDTVASSSLYVSWDVSGQVNRRILIYRAGTSSTLLVTDWETTSDLSDTLNLSTIVTNGQQCELVVEVELGGAVLTHSPRIPFVVILDPQHTVSADLGASGAVAVGAEHDTSAIRMVIGDQAGITSGNFVSWQVKEGPADWLDRWSAIDVELPEPLLVLTPGASHDRSGPVSPTITGAVRETDGQWFVEEGTTNYLPNPHLQSGTGGLGSWDKSAMATMVRETGIKPPGALASVHCTLSGTEAYENIGAVWVGSMPGGAQAWTGQIQIRGTGTIRLVVRVFVNGYGGARDFVSDPISLTNEWQRLEGVTHVMGGDTSVDQMHVMIADNWTGTPTGQSSEFWAALPQIEQKGYATSFCPALDDAGILLPGYTWGGTPHASASGRAGGLVSRPNPLPSQSFDIALQFQALTETAAVHQYGGLLLNSGDWGDNYLGLFRNPAGNVSLYTFGPSGSGFAGSVESLAPIDMNQPHTIQVAVTPSSIRMWIDGLLVGTVAGPIPAFAWDSDLLVGTNGGAQAANAAIGPVVISDILTDIERDRLVDLMDAGPLTWAEVGNDHSRWLAEAATLAAELETVAEVTAYDTAEITYYEPRLGTPQVYALVAVVQDGINQVESLPTTPITATCESTAIILSDERNPAGLRSYMWYLSGGAMKEQMVQTVVDTWDHDAAGDLPTIIESGSRYQVLTETFELLPTEAISPVDALATLKQLRGWRDDGSPIVACFRDDLGQRLWIRITDLGYTRERMGRLTVPVQLTEVHRG